jgi:hypothetical protein
MDMAMPVPARIQSHNQLNLLIYSDFPLPVPLPSFLNQPQKLSTGGAWKMPSLWHNYLKIKAKIEILPKISDVNRS